MHGTSNKKSANDKFACQVSSNLSNVQETKKIYFLSYPIGRLCFFYLKALQLFFLSLNDLKLDIFSQPVW